MSENLRLYHAGLHSMNAVVVRVDPARWDEPSQCAEWTCREVLGHVIWHTRSVAAACGNGEAPAAQPEAEIAAGDPLDAWIDARDRALAGLDRPGVINAEAPGPFGPMKLDDRLRFSASDVYTHSWDIGAAIGVDPKLDPGVAEALLPGLTAVGDGLRRPGLMGDEVILDGEASVVERFLAFCGRDPRRSR